MIDATRATSGRASGFPLAVSVHPARGRALLSLVLRTELRRSEGIVGSSRHLIEADLTDLHLGIDRDREVRHVREFQRHLTLEPGVDEACGRVDEQTEATQGRLPFEAGDDIIAEADRLERGSQHELAWVKDEGRVRGGRDFLGEVILQGLRIDERVAVVLEHPEAMVASNVDARRLDEVRVERIDRDTPVVDGFEDRPVGEDHGRG